ncbi:Transposase family Tnp2 protein [Ceratobasidium sp. AG-Ba]|nr:Transposase family Tnp2 protein [Ceratobasidium sp. AG-Ba]
MFQNVISTLLKLWTWSGNYWDFGTGNENYLIEKTAWDAICEACATSGDTIPSAFGCRVPNLAEKNRFVSAEARHHFAIQIAPALLGEFKHASYYHHFVRLVRLINLCTAFEITNAQLQEVRQGFAQWVQDYERLYYQYKADRLRACTLPIHALLHVADDIENMGPVWAYWAFPMERFNGSLAHANKNCRFVWASLDRHILEVTQLSQIKLIFGLKDALSLEEERYNIATGAHYESYPGLVFVRPSNTGLLHPTIVKKVARYISIELDIDERTVRDTIKDRRFLSWGRMQQIDNNGGGDLVRGHYLSPCRERITRDASYVKDLCDIAGVPNLRTDPLILAAISPFPTFRKINSANMVQFELTGKKLDIPEIVDVNNIDGLVGRVRTRKGDWYVVERTNVVGRMNLLDTMMDPR